MRAKREIAGGERGWAQGLLVDLAGAMRDVDDGDLVALSSTRDDVAEDLETCNEATRTAQPVRG